MVDLETLESREFDLVGWTIKRHPAFIRIYDAGETVLFTLKKDEVYDNRRDRYVSIDKMHNDLSIAMRKEWSLDEMDILSDIRRALEHAQALAETLE